MPWTTYATETCKGMKAKAIATFFGVFAGVLFCVYSVGVLAFAEFNIEQWAEGPRAFVFGFGGLIAAMFGGGLAYEVNVQEKP